MRYCPDCGYPKEVHSKTRSTARLPKVSAPLVRICQLEQTAPGVRRADADLYRKRLDRKAS